MESFSWNCLKDCLSNYFSSTVKWFAMLACIYLVQRHVFCSRSKPDNILNHFPFNESCVFNLLQHCRGRPSFVLRIKPQTLHPTVCVIFILEASCTAWTRRVNMKKRYQTETIGLLKRGSAKYPSELSESLPGDPLGGLGKSFQRERDGGRTLTNQDVLWRQTDRGSCW